MVKYVYGGDKMNGTTIGITTLATFILVLTITVTQTTTTANLTIGNWTINDEAKLTTDITGTSAIDNCPVELTNCQANYSGTVTVNIDTSSESFIITPDFTMSEITIASQPVQTEVPSEIISETISSE